LVKKAVLFVFFAFFTLFGDDLPEISSEPQEDESSKYEQTDTLSPEFLPENLPAFPPELSQNLPINLTSKDTISLESQGERVRNHRRIVVSAMMMMLFIGLCMASVSSINPE